MFSAHACDTDSRVVSLIPSMTMVGSMYGGMSPISDDVMVSQFGLGAFEKFL